MALCAPLLLVVLTTAPGPAPSAPVALDFRQLFVQTPAGPRIAPAVEALRGKRVRLVGYMVQMEDAPRGAFYLARRPAFADESGGGTGDLPPLAVRVELPHLAGQEVELVEGRVEAIGRLEIGRAEDEEGRVSWLRVIADPPAPKNHTQDLGPRRATSPTRSP
jgi:hypothetical protein